MGMESAAFLPGVLQTTSWVEIAPWSSAFAVAAPKDRMDSMQMPATMGGGGCFMREECVILFVPCEF
jgi:hypothetical protein